MTDTQDSAEAPQEAQPAPGASAADAPQVSGDGAVSTPVKRDTFIWGTGRRKKAVARVRIRPGKGLFLVNKREVDEYFPDDRERRTARAPLTIAENASHWEIHVNVRGGGISGQAGAVSLGLARALTKAVPELESTLRDNGLLTRDARMPERKKPGQPGARKRFQFSKR